MKKYLSFTFFIIFLTVFSVNHGFAQYCIPIVDNPCTDAYLNVVHIGNIDNYTDCSGYSDYTATNFTKAEPGQTLSYNIQTQSPNGQKVNIYVDFNNNGDFTDPGEHIVTDVAMYVGNYAYGNFTIPLSQAYGTYRMRITTDDYDVENDPCHVVNGEVEDYTLIIAACVPYTMNLSIAPGNPTNLCSGQSTVLQATIPAALSPLYIFTVTDGINNFGNVAGNNVGDDLWVPIFLDPTETSTYTLTNIHDIFGCLGTPSGSVTINVGSFNTTPTALVTQPSCSTGTGTITFSSPSGSQYGYSIGGAYQLSPVFNNVAPGTYTLSVQQNGDCISSSTAVLTVNAVAGPPAIPANISGIVNVCPYIARPILLGYHVMHDPAISSYAWTVPPTVTIINGQGTDSISVLIGSGFVANANKLIKVKALSACGSSAERLFYLLAQTPSTPAPIIASSSNICPNLGTNIPVTYTIPKTAGASAYIWTSPPNTIISHPLGTNENDTTVSVTFDAGFVTSAISVRSFNDCGVSNSRALTIVRSNPATPGLISGPTNICPYLAPNGIAVTYTVTAVPGVAGYNWNLPPVLIGLTGQGTNNVSFVYPAEINGGSFSVIATNGCGSSASRSISVTRLNPAAPGAIDVIQLRSCPTRRYSYTLASMPSNATSVQWTVPAAATGFSGQGTASIIVDYPATAVLGSVTATATSNCASSGTRSSTVKLPACPPPGFADKANNNALKMIGMTEPGSDQLEENIFPNPSQGDFNVRIRTDGKAGYGMLQLIGMNGNIISTKKITVNKDGMVITNFTANGLAAGIYQLRYTLGGNTGVLKVVIMK